MFSAQNRVMKELKLLKPITVAINSSKANTFLGKTQLKFRMYFLSDKLQKYRFCHRAIINISQAHYI